MSVKERARRALWPESVTLRLAAMRLAWEADNKLAAVAAALVLLGAAVPPLFTLASGALIGTVPEAARLGLGSAAGQRATTLLAAVGVLYAIQHVAQPIRGAVVTSLGRRLDDYVVDRVTTSVARPSGVAHLEQPDMLDLVQQAQGVALWETAPRRAVSGLSALWVARLSGVGSVLIVATYRWWFAVALVAAAAVTLRTKRKSFFNLAGVVVRRTGELRRSSYFRDIALGAEAAKETRVFGLGPWAVRRYDTAWLAVMRDVWRERRRGMGPVTAGLLANAAVTAGCFLLLARDAARGGIGLGAFATYAQALLGVSQLSWVLGNPEIDAEQGVAAIVPALRLDDAMAEAAASLAPATATEVDITALPRHHVRFRDVNFRYAGRDDDVLAGLDLDIAAGTSLAIVGENGAGKTTLVKLLARLYEPTGGVIEVDGVALTDLDPSAWQRRVAAIFQDFGRYPLPVTDNIGWGAIEHLGDRDALERAARRAGALEMIEALPFGWQSVLNRQFDNGVEISGGQWQRVALARALFAVEGGAGILVLDEPTAQLDVRAEADIYERFLELTRGLTTIVISNRFSTVRRADRIAVIAGGRVVEDGSHTELMALGGRYAEMFLLQADRFRSGSGSNREEDEEDEVVG